MHNKVRIINNLYTYNNNRDKYNISISTEYGKLFWENPICRVTIEVYMEALCGRENFFLCTPRDRYLSKETMLASKNLCDQFLDLA